MKKILSLLFVSVLTFGLFSCSKDDTEEGSKDVITINGEEYRMSRVFGMSGSWNDMFENAGEFSVCVLEDVGPETDVLYYTFYFESTKMPAVDDDFSKMSLTLIPGDGKGHGLDEFTYKSGSAKIISTDREKGRMTIDFDNLKMEFEGDTYTFDGTNWVDFNFDR